VKKKTAMWVCLVAGLLWVIVGLRDAFAPGFFSMAARVVTRIDIAMDFAAAAAFLVAAASFYMSKPKLDNVEQK
jgi:hypothetical protein